MSPTAGAPDLEITTKQEHGLSRQLTLRDLVLTQILTVVGSSWVGVAAGLGRAQAVVWIAAMLLFYAPMAVSVYYLNREMPLEGGLYVWARTAFGDAGGFMTAWNLWAYGLCVCATILYAMPTELAYLLGPSAAWIPANHWASNGVLAVVLAALTVSALRGLALGRWIHNVSGAAMLAVFVLLILTPFWALAHHVPLHYAPLALELPKRNLYSLALMGQMLGALSGLEYVAILAGEAKSPTRDISRSVVISSPIICAMFIFGTGSVLAFHQLHPGIAIDFIAPIPQTLRFAFGNHGAGNVLASLAILCVEMRLLGATSMIFTGVTRLPMTAGWDHLIPEWFSRLSKRNHVPVNSILVSTGIIAALLLLGSLGVKVAEAFQVLSNSSIELYALCYLVMFAIPIAGAKVLRRKLPRVVVWTSAVGFLATLFSSVVMTYPFVDVVDPRAYAAKILGTMALANAVGFVFYQVRRVPSLPSPPS
jgi:glutamate:GABA antiporter